MKIHAAFAVALLAAACTPTEAPVEHWKRCDESAALAANAEHENVRMRYQLIQSKFQDKNELWAPFEQALNAFGENRYAELAPLVLEQDIPTLQRPRGRRPHDVRGLDDLLPLPHPKT